MTNETTAAWNDVFGAVEALYELGWTDGLPVLPPTSEKVTEFLDAAGRDGSEIVGELPERRRQITAEKVAANAVMAGCKPEYMPVVLAAAEAMLAPEFNLVGPSSSMGGAATLVIVNGPIVQELGINSRNNLFGPGNRANSTIGRAMRLILMNACAAIPGLYDRSVIGHPGKFSYCIAEAETETHWTPLHVERGFSPDQSAVTLFASESPPTGTLGGPAGSDLVRHCRRSLIPGHLAVHFRLRGRPGCGNTARRNRGHNCRKQRTVEGLEQGRRQGISPCPHPPIGGRFQAGTGLPRRCRTGGRGAYGASHRRSGRHSGSICGWRGKQYVLGDTQLGAQGRFHSGNSGS